MSLDIEIVFDPVEEMLFNHLHMNENHEVLPDGEWIRSVRRRVGRDTLFMYYHHKTNKFVLADWCFPPTSTASKRVLNSRCLTSDPIKMDQIGPRWKPLNFDVAMQTICTSVCERS